MDPFKTSEADIILNQKEGVIYVADFTKGTGKYISIHEAGISADLDIKISPKIHLRITYLTKNDQIEGVKIAKVNDKTIEEISFSTMDLNRILQLLHLFSELDLKAIANRTVVLDKSIISNPDEVSKFLNLIASDPQGRDKLSEVANSYNLIQIGDINSIVQKKQAVELFDKILNSEYEFNNYKTELRVKKPEEVWQRFFSNNLWILGSDIIEILDERQVNVDSITDYLLKSFDGFLDIIELKLPNAPFWTSEQIPRSELTGAIMQCHRYILDIERKIDSVEFREKVENTPIVKPRITLVYGRSNNWNNEEKEACRVINSSYHNLNIITYDHLLERAKRIIGQPLIQLRDSEFNTTDLPF